MKKLFLLPIYFFPICIFAQVTIQIDTVPEYYTPVRDTIFLSGSFNSWNPSDTAYCMNKLPDGTFQFTLNASTGDTIEYKFTRGNLNTIETQADGSVLPNRTFIFSNGLNINCNIENWADMVGSHTATGNLRIVDLDFFMPQLNRSRRIWAYLPKDYYTSSNYYPVVYMQDGQSLFDELYSGFGEWGVDESMEALFDSFSPTAIIVGVDNGGIERINEYSPWVNLQFGGGQGYEYADFLVNSLKPYIDSTLRTMPERNNTAIMGSSLGGLVSFTTIFSFQNVFSKAGIFSPSFWFSDSVYTFIQQQGHQQNSRFYFVSGTTESSEMVPDIDSVINTMYNSGFSTNEILFVTKSDGLSSEWFWGREFEDAFKWLFFEVTPVTDISNETLEKVIYDASIETIFLYNFNETYRLKIFNTSGQQVLNLPVTSNSVNISDLSKSLYLLRLEGDMRSITQKIIK